MLDFSRRSFIGGLLAALLPAVLPAVLSQEVDARSGINIRSPNSLILILVTAAASPTLSYKFGNMLLVGDVLEWFDGVSSLGTHTVTQTDINNSGFTGGLSVLGSGAHVISVKQKRSAVVISTSNPVYFTV